METRTEDFKTIISKYDGMCRNCEKPFAAGTEILWKPGMAIHVKCEHSMPKAENFSKTAPISLPRIPNGTYTIVFEDGSYQTIKFEEAKKGAFAGRRIASFMSGTDNETHYRGFAFVSPDNKMHCWKTFQHYLIKDRVMEAVRILYKAVRENGEEAIMKAGEAYALRSGKCCKCGRKLTVPASIHRGMGPECSKKVW